jgi:hypothetical protein
MKSPGTVRGAPYTISAGEHRRYSFGVVQRFKRTQGSSCIQFGQHRRARSADLREQWNLSTNPLGKRWCGEVVYQGAEQMLMTTVR